MRTLQTEVLVIGGGATGTGVVRDLALRGFKAILVEKGDLTHGTTGRYHGLLHSGGRYAVKDPQAARECIEENRILRKIMPQCIEDTGGFFVVTPWDDPGYAPLFVEGCKSAGIPVEEVPISEMLRREPLLNPRILRCFQVPDGSADSFLAAHLNLEAARAYGAQALTYHKVERLLQSETGEPRVIGALCQDLAAGEPVRIMADYVVNAAGAWAGELVATLGLEVKIIPGKGVMLAMSQRIVNTVINRCRLPSDGDILVPTHSVSVIGTTDVKVENPDHFSIEPWEVQLCLLEGDKLVPGFKEMRMLRAWAGVRPLYQETTSPDTLADDRAVTRAFVLLDHESRDGLPGLATITGGKWTTYRKMAEVTVDLVCSKLGVNRPCRTHLEPLPDPHKTGSYHMLSGRLARVEADEKYGELICECELVTRQEVEDAILHKEAKTIDDIRRDVRLGMGPCQGGFCAFRAAGLIHELASSGRISTLAQPDVEATNTALRDFLQERWKGLLPILWGQQLRQERLDELIYLDLLNADHLPGPTHTRLAPENYAPHDRRDARNLPSAQESSRPPQAPAAVASPNLDVLVIGAGLAGLAAAWSASERGLRTRLIAKGWGSDFWSAGTIGVLGYSEDGKLVETPIRALQALIRKKPDHPYARIGLDEVAEALETFRSLCEQAGYPMQGSLERNWLLPSALGAARPVCLAPATMTAGDLHQKIPTLIIGFVHFQDFYPHLIADNLQALGIPARALLLELKSLASRRFTNSRNLAQLFETAAFRQELVAALASRLGDAQRVGFPAALGLDKATQVHAELQQRLGIPVFEIPTLPPSIPGMRLHRLLIAAIESQGGRVQEGMQVSGSVREGRRVRCVRSEAAGRDRLHSARYFILATGGILGGGVKTAYDGAVFEPIFDLPLHAPPSRDDWLRRDFFSPEGHPIFQTGVAVDHRLRPLDFEGEIVFENLHVVGGALGGCDPILERSLEGIALASGFAAGRSLGESA